jgi:dipeptidyl aminopeptidase/acylaminoacyl peptidase
VGFLPESSYQIYVLDVESGEITQLTTGPYDCLEPEWSPDGEHIAFVSARFPDYELSYVKDIWVVPSQGGEMKRLTSSDAVLSSPSWSPDGRAIACYGHDNGYKGATVPGYAWWTGGWHCQVPYKAGPSWSRPDCHVRHGVSYPFQAGLVC